MWLPGAIQDSSVSLLLLSQASFVKLEEARRNLKDDERDDAERSKAAGFNILKAITQDKIRRIISRQKFQVKHDAFYFSEVGELTRTDKQET